MLQKITLVAICLTVLICLATNRPADAQLPPSDAFFYGSPYKLKWYYIDKTGKLVIEPRFYQGANFSEGLARVAVLDKEPEPER